MGAHYQYLALLGVCLVGTVFLEFRFDARIWRRPLSVVRALAVPWLVFNVVNEVAVFRGLWFYNPQYVTGWRVPRHYPIEEMCFFVAIPVCALLTFEAATAVYSGRVVPPWGRPGRAVAPLTVRRAPVDPRPNRAVTLLTAAVLAVASGLLGLALFEVHTDTSVRSTALRDYQLVSRHFDWNVREYPVLAVLLMAGVLLLEWAWWRTGLFRMRAYWSTMVICLLFMVPVNGWLTKLTAPVVIYAADEFSGLRPIWDIPLEDYAFGVALLTLVLMSWVRVTRGRVVALQDTTTAVSASAVSAV